MFTGSGYYDWVNRLESEKDKDKEKKDRSYIKFKRKDELFNLQTRFKKGIFSQETALFLFDLTDRIPIKYHMTFPLRYNTTSLNSENVKYCRVKNDIYELGREEYFCPACDEFYAGAFAGTNFCF